mgnify:CR=1 FL=1
MRDVHVIQDLEQLKGLTEPLRFRIIKALMEGPTSTAELARALDEKPNKLHYHVSELQRLGLIEVAAAREKGNLIERAYRPVASYFRIDPGLFRNAGEASSVLVQNAMALLDTTAVDLERVEAAMGHDRDLSAEILQTHLTLHLSDEDAQELRERLRTLLDEFRGREVDDAEREIRLTLVLYPWDDTFGVTND